MKNFSDYHNDFNELARAIHQSNVDAGWWLNDPKLTTKLQLVITEIAEATEGERKDLMDDHLPHRKMGEVELADALIRYLDLGGRLGLQHVQHVPHNVCGKLLQPEADGKVDPFPLHLELSRQVTLFHEWGITDGGPCSSFENEIYSETINSIVRVAEALGYDLMGALFEKWEYNTKRPDHKLENRNKPGGKKV